MGCQCAEITGKHNSNNKKLNPNNGETMINSVNKKESKEHNNKKKKDKKKKKLKKIRRMIRVTSRKIRIKIKIIKENQKKMRKIIILNM